MYMPSIFSVVTFDLFEGFVGAHEALMIVTRPKLKLIEFTLSARVIRSATGRNWFEGLSVQTATKMPFLLTRIPIFVADRVGDDSR
jgi:hypothetical protein